jgi:hypothetical protein
MASIQATIDRRLSSMPPAARQAYAALQAEQGALLAEAARFEEESAELTAALSAAEGELSRSSLKQRALDVQVCVCVCVCVCVGVCVCVCVFGAGGMRGTWCCQLQGVTKACMHDFTCVCVCVCVLRCKGANPTDDAAQGGADRCRGGLQSIRRRAEGGAHRVVVGEAGHRTQLRGMRVQHLAPAGRTPAPTTIAARRSWRASGATMLPWSS